MKTAKFIIVVCLLTLFTSCSKDNSDLAIQEQTNVKKLTFKHQSQSFTIDYKIENDEFVLLSEFPKELIELRKNENLSLELGNDNSLWLVETTELAAKNVKSSQSNLPNDFFEHANFFKRFGLEKLNHLGFVVNNQTTALRNYSSQYNIKQWYKAVLTSKKYFINETPLDYNVDLTFGFTGGNQVEVMQADANENNIFGNFLKQNEGLHHLGFSVRNLESTTRIFNANGYPTTVSGVFKTKLGLVSKIRFFDTRNATGSYTEIVEAKLFGFNVTQDESLFIFGLIIGDAKVVKP